MRPDKFNAGAESLVIVTDEAARHGVSADRVGHDHAHHDEGEFPG